MGASLKRKRSNSVWACSDQAAQDGTTNRSPLASCLVSPFRTTEPVPSKTCQTIEPLPMRPVVAKSVPDHRVRLVDPVQGRTREDHAEAKGIGGLIPFEQHHLGVRNGLLEQG